MTLVCTVVRNDILFKCPERLGLELNLSTFLKYVDMTCSNPRFRHKERVVGRVIGFTISDSVETLVSVKTSHGKKPRHQ